MQSNPNIDTALETSTSELPPKNTIGVWGWLRKNLFSSWLNTLLTIVTVWFVYAVLNKSLSWILGAAEWQVIAANFRLIFVGQYPVEELWRIWLSLSIVSALMGLSWGLWRGTMANLSVSLSFIYFIVAVMPFIQSGTRVWLFMNIALVLSGYFIGKKLTGKWVKRAIIAAWLLSFPVTIVLIKGFGVLPDVATNVWGGFLLTILITIVGIIFSFPLGILLALGRTSKLPVVRWFCITYIEVIRGVPLITVFFTAQIMIPLFIQGFEINNIVRVMIGVSLFTAAYAAENVRGGLQSIPRGQYEAAQALGLSTPRMMFFVILPQALRAVIPAMVGQYISMFKDTSLVAIVGLFDLLGIGKTIVSNPDFLGKHMEVYLFIALIYWVVAFSMSYASRRMEKSLGVGER